MYDNDKAVFYEGVKEFQAENSEEILSAKSVKILEGSQWPNLVIVSYNKKSGDYITNVRGYEFILAGAGGAYELRSISSY